MRKYIAIVVFILMLTVNSSFAYNINKMATDSKVISALRVLEANGMTDVLDRIERNKIKVMFYDLTLLSFSYSKHYAVASTDSRGDKYIMINSNLARAPKEALACLIAHESVHELSKATYEEEVRATTVEAKAWIALKDKVVGNYENDRLVKRLDKLAAMHNTSDERIASSISNNTFYQTQLAR